MATEATAKPPDSVLPKKLPNPSIKLDEGSPTEDLLFAGAP